MSNVGFPSNLSLSFIQKEKQQNSKSKAEQKEDNTRRAG